MGYSLYIGEAKLATDKEIDEHWIYIDCETFKDIKGAPDYGDVNPCESTRWPSYTQWSEFAKSVNLYDYFFDEENGVIKDHPGTHLLTNEDYNRVNFAFGEYKKKYKKELKGIARYKLKRGNSNFTYEEMIKYNYVRLHWLVFWIKYALDNCKYPIFQNG